MTYCFASLTLANFLNMQMMHKIKIKKLKIHPKFYN